ELGQAFAVLHGLARLRLERDDQRILGCHDVVAHAQHVDISNDVAAAHVRAGGYAIARREVANAGRGDLQRRPVDGVQLWASAVGRPIGGPVGIRSVRLSVGSTGRGRGRVFGALGSQTAAQPDAPAILT